MTTTGDLISTVRFDEFGQESWAEYRLGRILSNSSGFADVYLIDANTTPPLVAKIYRQDGDIQQQLRTDEFFALRLYALGRHAARLATALPFAAFPRRLIFPRRSPSSTDQATELLGFTMAEMTQTISLLTFLTSETIRQQVSLDRSLAIAERLAHYLHRLHTDPMRFAIGDLSPNNILISKAFDDARYIDLDGAAFTYPGTPARFFPSPLPKAATTGYESPYFFQDDYVGPTPEHDTFVLAIFIFQLIMAALGETTPPHPFEFGDHTVSFNIKNRLYPYRLGNQHLLRPAVVATYTMMPDMMRHAFDGYFTGQLPMTADAWASLIARYRRSLQSSSFRSYPVLARLCPEDYNVANASPVSPGQPPSAVMGWWTSRPSRATARVTWASRSAARMHATVSASHSPTDCRVLI